MMHGFSLEDDENSIQLHSRQAADSEASDEEIAVEPAEPKDTPMKRLANIINSLESVIWDYLKLEYTEIYNATRRKRNLNEAIKMINDEKEEYLQTYRSTFYQIFGFYEPYYRLDDILRLASYRNYLETNFNNIKQILKTIRQQDTDWTKEGIREIVLVQNKCEYHIETVLKNLKAMQTELTWKTKHNISDLKEDDKIHEYRLSKNKTIKYRIRGMRGDYSGNSRFSEAIKKEILKSIHSDLKTLPAALKSYLMPKFVRVINERIEAANKIEREKEPLIRDNRAKSATIEQQSSIISKQEERLKILETDREAFMKKFSELDNTLFAQKKELHQLRLDMSVQANVKTL
jgi:hypothetical protein